MASSSSNAERVRRAAVVALLAVMATCTSGCLSMYLRRDPLPPAPPPPPPPWPRAKATGSLWRDDVSANYLFSDTRAHFAGDLLTIVITESSSGSKEATTSTSTESEIFANLEEFFGLPQQLANKNP